jgi:AcrR family transcriptional regulator
LTAKPKARRGKPQREPGVAKSETTRRHLLDRALELFQQRGVEATTMRDIAKAAGMSLGAAYYYFPSKEALVFAFYEENQQEIDRLEVKGSLKEQIAALLHAKLRAIRGQRRMLGTIVQRLVDPSDPLSAFSSQTKAVRDRAIGVFAKPLREAGLPAEAIAVLAHALWMFQLAVMLVYINDETPGQKRTHGLVDDTVEMLAPLVPILSTPLGKGILDRVVAALDRAGIAVL